MNFPLLKQIFSKNEAPLQSYLFYVINGGIYWLDVGNYSDFVSQWIGAPPPLPPLTLDLSSVAEHSIILDFDYKMPHPTDPISILSTIQSVLKTELLSSMPHFTYILATRPRGHGIHVHLPEFKIGHDDYILLCQRLQIQFRRAMSNVEYYLLDILQNAVLPDAAKPGFRPYEAKLLVYIDERQTCTLKVSRPDIPSIQAAQKSFKILKSNSNSLFRELLKCSPELLTNKLKRLMMPVIDERESLRLAYPTSIGPAVATSRNDGVVPPSPAAPSSASSSSSTIGVNGSLDVASFTYKRNRERGFVSKGKRLSLITSKSDGFFLKTYHYLRLNTKIIREFETANHALKMWYERFSSAAAAAASGGGGGGGGGGNGHIPEAFREVHDTLQFEHAYLANNPNPIKTVMQFREGYYFLPVFYALCRHLDAILRHPSAVLEQMFSLLDPPFHPLLEKLRDVLPNNMMYTMSDVSLNTLHFCANNLCEGKPQSYREKLKSIVYNNRRSILSVTTHDQMVQLVRNIQDRHLPVRVLRLKNALKKPTRYIWNALGETWQEVVAQTEISDHVWNLWNVVKEMLNDYRQSGGRGGPDDDVIHKFNVSAVISAIMSETSMERKDVQMDSHKWFLRLHDGVLDLLTGHVGGVVPEFFLSDRKIDLGISRTELMTFCNRSPTHSALYDRLTDPRFFNRYLRNVFLDVTGDNLLDPLFRSLETEEEEEEEKNKKKGSSDDNNNDDKVSKSMIHFYVNLCKYTSFEYDMLMYMLDVLASVYVATNYERKFFVFRGLTRNGKSKLFELMGRVLGGYYHSIQSENLCPGHSVQNASPELASTLFSCRMVSTEELDKKVDENRIKQITGNSFVAFRNMYEQNSGGIPTAKLFASTNNYPECKASEAFKDRVVAIPFDAEFTDLAPDTPSKQVETNTYKKDAYVVERSYVGCFFLLYYHLKKHMNPEDGLLHYRERPEYVVEYTADYLVHADIYVQFKSHMDVQLKPSTVTTMNEVKSAVRQYLKTTKNTSFHESDLIVCFEKEFGHLRRSDPYFGSSAQSFGYASVVDDDDDNDDAEDAETTPERKRVKMSHDEVMVVYYEGVHIKNLRKTANGENFKKKKDS